MGTIMWIAFEETYGSERWAFNWFGIKTTQSEDSSWRQFEIETENKNGTKFSIEFN